MTTEMNLMGDFVMDEGQIVARGRDLGAVNVSIPRQDELRNIMIGHLAGLRALTPEEMAEAMQVQADMQAAKEWVDQARADAALLRAAKAYEKALCRLAQPAYGGPTVDEEGNPHPDMVRDAEERDAATDTIHDAEQMVVDLVAARAEARQAEQVEPEVTE